MARRPTPRRTPAAAPRATSRAQAGPASAVPGKSDRERVIAAFMDLLAEKPFEDIGFAEIASSAGVSLAQLRDLFGSTLSILGAHMKEVDRQVLAGSDADMADEPPRERLFDVLMRRIELLEPHKEAIRSLLHSASRNPGLALALNSLGVRSQQWMLTAADISSSGPKGMVRSQGLALLFASVLRTWLDDIDPASARTLAALDRALARGQRWSGFLDDLCSVPARLCRGRSRRRRRDLDEDTMAA
jgi:AcrR family transcriptional regulator